MNKIEILTQKVKALYDQKDQGRADWSDWMYDNHVSVVVKYGIELADRFGANKNIVLGACLTHDIADALMKREDDGFDKKSLEIAGHLLTEANFTDQEKEVILGEIIPNHSCGEGDTLSSLEGRVMATADALAHFNTGFYFVAIYKFAQRGDSMEKIREWALKKIEKDFNRKIFFEEVREETKDNYETIKKFLTL